jgi:hypothetical protein
MHLFALRAGCQGAPGASRRANDTLETPA